MGTVKRKIRKCCFHLKYAAQQVHLYCLYVNIPLDDALFVNNYSTVCITVKVVSIEYK